MNAEIKQWWSDVIYLINKNGDVKDLPFVLDEKMLGTLAAGFYILGRMKNFKIEVTIKDETKGGQMVKYRPIPAIKTLPKAGEKPVQIRQGGRVPLPFTARVYAAARIMSHNRKAVKK